MPSNDLKQTFEALTEQCVWLNEIYTMQTKLFTSPSAAAIQQATAPVFFFYIGQLLRDAFILQVCKLNDPATTVTRGQSVTNLTVKHVNELLKQEGLMTKDILAASAGMEKFYGDLKPVRDKLISHLDKGVVLASQWLSPVLEADVTKFFEHLYSYVDLVGVAIGVGPLDFEDSPGAADVPPLLQHLKDGRRYRLACLGLTE
jgi:hypothetical protein